MIQGETNIPNTTAYLCIVPHVARRSFAQPAKFAGISICFALRTAKHHGKAPLATFLARIVAGGKVDMTLTMALIGFSNVAMPDIEINIFASIAE